jgi:hypothetical protein
LKRIFLTTVDPEVHVAHKIVVGASKINNDKYGYCDSVVLKDLKLSLSVVLYAIPLLFLLLKSLFYIVFLPKQAIEVKYFGILFGRYAVASAYRDFDAYQKRTKFRFSFLKSILRCWFYYHKVKPIIPIISAAFIDHGCYEKGIFFEIFSAKAKPIYHIDYPYGLVRLESSQGLLYEDALQVKRKPLTEEGLEKGRTYLLSVVQGRSKIPYLTVDYDDFNRESRFDYVIYTHSFTDAQLLYGSDGAFENLLDWLDFTVNQLSGKKVCIKAHPGVYNTKITSQVCEWDRKIFENYVENLNTKDVTVIDYPVNNVDFLKGLNKDAILISHHGNALLEASFLGFKCISSCSVNWREFDLFNEWYGRRQYAELLKKSYDDLLGTDMDELYLYYFSLVDNKSSYFSKKHWQRTISNIAEIPLSEVIDTPYMMDDLDDLTVGKIRDAVESDLQLLSWY